MSNLRSGIKAFLTAPAPAPYHPVYRYVMLIWLLCLLVAALWFYLYRLPEHRAAVFGVLAAILQMVLGHLAYSFRWPPAVIGTLRVLYWGWSVFVIFYFIYLARVIYL